ncbi:MAG: GTP-binding protein [Deltaproteobacteria bacterium]|nr:GTP-binding protein [Deltaproteobacteria bacterium]MBM4393363.1 GTP-binding protein [Deltaproteobacteria bacterium]
MNRQVPVLVVGGFLGSGKTTLVRRLLADAQARGVRMAVISNEFGELGIDAALIGAGGTRMVELAGGCVCCSLSDALVDTLEDLRATADPDRIVIECSGLALPFDTQLHLYRPPVRDWVGDEACVVVVDAERWDEPDALFEEQVQSADLVLLSKLDLVDAPTRQKAYERIQKLVPDVTIIEVIHGDVSVDLLYPAGPRAAREASDDHAHDHAHHHADWTSAELRAPEGLDEPAMLGWLEAHRGVRTKGFVRVGGAIRVVQGVGRRIDLAEPGDLPVEPSLVGRVVVIRRPGA